MHLMSASLLFASTFVLVFALGLQSQLTNNGHYLMAFGNSLLIGSANLVVLKLGPDATGWQIFGYLAGGPLGIVCAMYVFRRWIGRKRNG
ncbi:hypothetical protein MW7_007195 [Imbroritus primus]|uniref:Uncharacterized protein n=1 Tax=Imbroritus primus TaxID=3058603 RepID=A0ACD3SQG1_9BURK|nr:hypothetical protein MW7_007195 [Burkholderiaceae bacterium PBA]